MTYTEQRLLNSLKRYKSPITLASNQRIKYDKKWNVNLLEEKQSFKTCDGVRHRCWVTIGIVE